MDAPADTIFARASGAGRAGVAVYRVSGPRAGEAAAAFLKADLKPRVATLASVYTPYTDEIIDTGLALFFPGPRSFTGEDVLELHLHGSAAVENALYAALRRFGARPAAPGAFTRRALENGKLDLAQVEGLADLIDAETEAQRRQALGQLDGRLSAQAQDWRDRLVAILAALEADVDFPDEEDVPAAVANRAGPQIAALKDALEARLAEAQAARTVREGVEIVLAGRPNAGKSSLLNALSGTDAAIVSPTPGTTRDAVAVRIDLGGVPAALVDTAGLRAQTADAVEKEGVRRARERVRGADLVVAVVDPHACEPGEYGVSRETIDALGGRAPDLVVLTKADLRSGDPGPVDSDRQDLAGADPPATLAVSSTTGEGIDALIARLTQDVAARVGAVGDGALTRARHAEAVERAIAALARAQSALDVAPELAAEDVRLAARALGAITGAVDVEAVLGAIFASFCIGK
ncbi:MAG: tRNA uridine-5-carboxymethylaminomethyl(34) synthesis GTPase MnmE [Pseudomonadota bacterium]